MAGPAVDALLYLLAEAFDGRGIEESNESRSLLGTDDRWRWQQFEDARQ